MFHGLRVTPVRGLSPPPALAPNSVVVVLPRMQDPADLIRSTEGASDRATLSALVLDPNVVRTPATSIKSFTESGIPCNFPS